MEVEVKLKLPDAQSHQKLISLLSPFHLKTHRQYNTFFDGAATELSFHRIVIRIRFYDDDAKWMVCLKCKAIIIDGVSRGAEDEEEIDPLIGRECVANPMKLCEVDSMVMKKSRVEFGVGELGFVFLGGFKNVRGVWVGALIAMAGT